MAFAKLQHFDELKEMKHTIWHNYINIKIKDEYFLLKFGGFLGHDYSNQVFMFDIQTNMWYKALHIKNEVVPSRRARSMIAQYSNKEIIIFGGSNSQLVFNDIFIFNYNSQIWREAETQKSPSPRYGCGHFTIIDQHGNNSFYVYAGQGGSELINQCKPLKEVFLLNLYSFQWVELLMISQENIPQGLGWNSIVLDSNYVLAINENNLYDIRIFDLAKNIWYSIIPQGYISRSVKGVSFCKVQNKNDIYAFGGQTQNDYLQGFYLLQFDYDFRNMTWYNIFINGDLLPVGRKYPTLISYNNLIVIYGGQGEGDEILSDMYLFNQNYNLYWEEQEIEEGTVPKYPVTQHAMVHLPDKNEIMIYGGEFMKNSLFDIYLYNYVDQYWSKVEINSRPLSYHSAVYYQATQRVYFFGGINLNFDINNFTPEQQQILQQNDKISIQNVENKYKYPNEMFYFDSEWELFIASTGKNNPVNRVGHVAFVFEKEMWIIGGFIPKKGYTSDLLIFNMEKEKWETYEKQLEIPLKYFHQNQPISRVSHSVTVSGHIAYLVGGTKHGVPIDDIWIINLLEKSIQLMSLFQENIPLFGHISVMINDNSLLIYGGINKKLDDINASQALGEVTIIQKIQKDDQIQYNQLRNIKIKGPENDKQRVYHRAVNVNNSIYIFGGCASLKMKRLVLPEIFDFPKVINKVSDIFKEDNQVETELKYHEQFFYDPELIKQEQLELSKLLNKQQNLFGGGDETNRAQEDEMMLKKSDEDDIESISSQEEDVEFTNESDNQRQQQLNKYMILKRLF